ncbi:MAG: FAD-dependent oxidoreductase, partial [Flavobacteriaceae bacterium]|nr:FAD-dependent oxidoreductase [Flavobacteriaceae bacterium]
LEKALETQRNFLCTKQQFRTEFFDYNALEVQKHGLRYKDIQAKHIVFCEGMGVNQNPFFKAVNIIGNKGQTLRVYIPNLKLQHIIKASVFLLPLSNKNFKVGATYERFYEDDKPTYEGTKYLMDELQKMLRGSAELLQTSAGIRPTTPNRRPVVGKHPEKSNLWILNGMGTRGVLLAPWAVAQLTQAMRYNTAIDPEVDVARFF